MMEKSNGEKIEPEFKQIIAGYTDDEIRSVLKKRKLYQKDAADFAIQEAIKRGIIYSEQDLFAREYKYQPEKFSVFPNLEDEKLRSKFKKSIARAFIILGVIPMVLGAVKIYETQSLLGILMFSFGVAWSLTSWQLMRKVNLKLVYFLYLLLALLTGYLIKITISTKAFITIDILVMVIAIGTVFYGIGFLGRLEDKT